jgi:hypothetical protein
MVFRANIVAGWELGNRRKQCTVYCALGVDAKGAHEVNHEGLSTVQVISWKATTACPRLTVGCSSILRPQCHFVPKKRVAVALQSFQTDQSLTNPEQLSYIAFGLPGSVWYLAV